MYDDPIVDSVRQVRDNLAGAFGYDVHAIFADLREREVGVGDRLVKPPEMRKPAPSLRPRDTSGD